VAIAAWKISVIKHLIEKKFYSHDRSQIPIIADVTILKRELVP
jgi:hypothetical protein